MCIFVFLFVLSLLLLCYVAPCRVGVVLMLCCVICKGGKRKKKQITRLLTFEEAAEEAEVLHF